MQAGTARPYQVAAIIKLVFEGVEVGELGIAWARSFLRAADVSEELRRDILPALTIDAVGTYPLTHHAGEITLALDLDDPDADERTLCDGRCIELLQIPSGWRVIDCVGGAAAMDTQSIAAIETLFASTLVPFCEARGAVVLSGGTDMGVSRDWPGSQTSVSPVPTSYSVTKCSGLHEG